MKRPDKPRDIMSAVEKDVAGFVMKLYLLGFSCYAVGIITGIVLHIIWVKP